MIAGLAGGMCIRTFNPAGDHIQPRCTNPRAEGSDLCNECGQQYASDRERRRETARQERSALVDVKGKLAAALERIDALERRPAR